MQHRGGSAYGPLSTHPAGATLLLYLPVRVLKDGKDFLTMALEELADRREPYVAATTNQEPLANVLFEFGDLLGDRRLGYFERKSGVAEASLRGDFHERVQGGEVQVSAKVHPRRIVQGDCRRQKTE